MKGVTPMRVFTVLLILLDLAICTLMGCAVWSDAVAGDVVGAGVALFIAAANLAIGFFLITTLLDGTES